MCTLYFLYLIIITHIIYERNIKQTMYNYFVLMNEYLLTEACPGFFSSGADYFWGGGTVIILQKIFFFSTSAPSPLLEFSALGA